MFEYLYEWLRNLSFYLILVTAVLHVLPGKGYRKYIRFFTGLVMILMILTPILQVIRDDYKVAEFYDGFDFEKTMKEIEEEMKEINQKAVNQNTIQNTIEVEEIVVGP